MADWTRESFAVTRARACGLVELERSSYYYRAHPRDNRALLIRLKELAAVRVRYGYRRLTILLRREPAVFTSKFGRSDQTAAEASRAGPGSIGVRG